MTMRQKPERVLASVHETAEGLTAAGVMSKQTMCEFDELCLTPVQPLTPEEIRELPEREGVSQAVLARYLNVAADRMHTTPAAIARRESGR